LTRWRTLVRHQPWPPPDYPHHCHPQRALVRISAVSGELPSIGSGPDWKSVWVLKSAVGVRVPGSPPNHARRQRKTRQGSLLRGAPRNRPVEPHLDHLPRTRGRTTISTNHRNRNRGRYPHKLWRHARRLKQVSLHALDVSPQAPAESPQVPEASDRSKCHEVVVSSPKRAGLAQTVEQLFRKQLVAGLTPAAGTTIPVNALVVELVDTPA
jgi:hypothetical protein